MYLQRHDADRETRKKKQTHEELLEFPGLG